MNNPLVGTWKLVSCEARLANGQVSYPYGAEPVGVLMYDAAGHMAVQLTHPDRPLFATADKSQGTAYQNQLALKQYEAYFGVYEIDGAQVRHHVWGSLLPNWTGGVQERFFEFADDQLILSTAEIPYNGTRLVGVLVWERIDKETVVPAGVKTTVSRKN